MAPRQRELPLCSIRMWPSSSPVPERFVIKVKAGDTGETEKSYTEKAAHTLKAGYNYQYNFTSTNELILNGITVERFVETTEQDAGNAT